jgi:hypothetical protein
MSYRNSSTSRSHDSMSNSPRYSSNSNGTCSDSGANQQQQGGSNKWAAAAANAEQQQNQGGSGSRYAGWETVDQEEENNSDQGWLDRKTRKVQNDSVETTRRVLAKVKEAEESAGNSLSKLNQQSGNYLSLLFLSLFFLFIIPLSPSSSSHTHTLSVCVLSCLASVMFANQKSMCHSQEHLFRSPSQFNLKQHVIVIHLHTIIPP